MVLDIVHVHFDCAGSQNLGGWEHVLVATALSLWHRAPLFAHGDHFSWQAQGKPRVLVPQSRLFVTGARGLEVFDFEVQFLWQAQRLGHGGDRQGAQIS